MTASSTRSHRALPALISTQKGRPGGWREASLRLIARGIRSRSSSTSSITAAGAENRAEVVTVGLMARRRYFVKQGNLLSPPFFTVLRRKTLDARDAVFSSKTITAILSRRTLKLLFIYHEEHLKNISLIVQKIYINGFWIYVSVGFVVDIFLKNCIKRKVKFRNFLWLSIY